MNGVAAAVLFLVLPAVVVVGFLVLPARSTTWSDQHPLAAHRLGMVGGGLGLAVAVFWAGRFFRWL